MSNAEDGEAGKKPKASKSKKGKEALHRAAAGDDDEY